ncbi:GDSL-type esterase/lipase family protein [Actinospica sp.]|uniref:GDSL-type esterase/lipase family protein n=1 Tax=Actinospica sp. TaxID=1872142 RepID=UPI002D020D8D|nr:GDSL-type esterase/lipase family protein [Actinospica sp.]HWG24283.1 GDSL-type esterase/lipase family protein [Actinospica sp.]
MKLPPIPHVHLAPFHLHLQPNQRRRRRIRRLLLGVVAILAIATTSAWLALLVTPAQSVSTAGQTIQVGAAEPTLSLSGPGELDLFGQNLPTVLQFNGLIRPKLELTHISLDTQLAQFVEVSTNKHNATGDLSSVLINGWEHYFFWQTLIAGAFAVVLLLAVAGVRRYPHRTTIKVVALGTLAAVALNVGFVVAFAAGAPGTLRQVHSLDDLVGRTAVGAAPKPVGASLPGVQAVVLGDSTAAGLGNPLVKNASSLDTACGRSSDAYAADLASVNGWNVLNLACSGATVADGVLGAQTLGTTAIAAPQFAVLEQASHVSVVIVSIGANDLQWEAMAAMCAMGPTCDDQATAAMFQANLATFTQDYYQLLHDLAALPAHPRVLINEYFSPFGSNVSCLNAEHLTPGKTAALLSRLGTLNQVLASGAKTFGFTTVVPDFSGHELCTAQPFVQGLSNSAPMHPNTAGELAIALADQQALSKLASSTAVMAESTGSQ